MEVKVWSLSHVLFWSSGCLFHCQCLFPSPIFLQFGKSSLPHCLLFSRTFLLLVLLRCVIASLVSLHVHNVYLLLFYTLPHASQRWSHENESERKDMATVRPSCATIFGSFRSIIAIIVVLHTFETGRQCVFLYVWCACVHRNLVIGLLYVNCNNIPVNDLFHQYTVSCKLFVFNASYLAEVYSCSLNNKPFFCCCLP